MKIPLSWLKEWVPVKAKPEELAEVLTFAGFEVEGIEEFGKDVVLDVNVTPNRGDALSVLGIAREVAALYKVLLKKPAFKKAVPSKASPGEAIPVDVRRKKACPRYALGLLRGVKVGPSPEWLARRLESVGLRTVNNVVDVTNYLMIETGQPLHAFDRKKLTGHKIAVRSAHEAEKIKTLDSQERTLHAEDLVIADDTGPIAIAGVMGAARAEVDAETTEIALECAWFDPPTIRKTARRLGLKTEASYRFERRVDPEAISETIQRAISMIIDVAGGEVAGPVEEVFQEKKIETPKVHFSPSHLRSLMGGEWEAGEIQGGLQRLGFGVSAKSHVKDMWEVEIPSYRGDIERAEDVIEEVVRLLGYENIPPEFPPLKHAPIVGEASTPLKKRMRTLLVDAGLRETIHYTFGSPEAATSVRPVFMPREVEAGLTLANPLGREFSVLRSSLVPGLLATTAHQMRHKLGAFHAFEMGKIFGKLEGHPWEKKILAGVLSGLRPSGHWSGGNVAVDFFDLKGVVEKIVRLCGLESETAIVKSQDIAFLHPGKQAAIHAGGKILGSFGEIHPDAAETFEMKIAPLVFEIDWESLIAYNKKTPPYRAFTRLPLVERDLALLLDEGVAADEVIRFLKEADETIREALVFDLYKGGQVPQGKKSLAFSLRLGRDDRTLTDDEVLAVHEKLISGLKHKFGAQIR